MTHGLKDKNIILGVSGGIAAYKSVELLRLMTRQEAAVRVVMTRNAQHFVGWMTFQALSGRPVCTSLFEKADEIGGQKLAEDHWLRHAANTGRGRLLVLRGRLDEAGPLLVDAYEGMCAAFSPAHPYAIESQYYLATYHAARGETHRACSLLSDAIAKQNALAIGRTGEISAIAVPYVETLTALGCP